ncbi:MAG TPA: farnesyl diphosphate synthase [Geminicoccaceae bacterium]|nr:farnesyl diphosphate synthase [Geminicoccaceae bacterium]
MSADLSSLAERMAVVAEAVELELDRLLPHPAGGQARLQEAMRYAVLGGGKRLRPFLVAAGAELLDVPSARALRVGAAVELIHGYSLVHDDLPAMDDALTRRGRPSCHRQFDEATAILVGDALQSLAFEVLAQPATHPDPAIRCVLVQKLARAAGVAGMCGGQMIDLKAEGRSFTMRQVLELQRLKTGALLEFACEAGAVLGGAPETTLEVLRAYAADLGLAFQIQDDLLDVTGDAAVAGKDLGRDAAAGKATVVGLLGVEGARARLSELSSSADRHLQRLGREVAVLHQVFEFVISRSN